MRNALHKRTGREEKQKARKTKRWENLKEKTKMALRTKKTQKKAKHKNQVGKKKTLIRLSHLLCQHVPPKNQILVTHT